MIAKKHKGVFYSEPYYFINRPSFMDGMSSIYDIYNIRRTMPHFSHNIDLLGMKSDFDLVGKDFHQAFRKFNHEFENQK